MPFSLSRQERVAKRISCLCPGLWLDFWQPASEKPGLKHLFEKYLFSIELRQVRLAAIRSFFPYASFFVPTALPSIQQVLAIPMRRYNKPLLGFLSREEVEAIQSAPDRTTWSGRRDHSMLITLYNTGIRVSELAGMAIGDLKLGGTSFVQIHGKGRKDRSLPLWTSTVTVLKSWNKEISNNPRDPLFPSRHGDFLSRSGIAERLTVAANKAADSFPALHDRKISPHTIRHTTAMHLLESGVDITVIALWLGHENPATTHRYIEADLAMKKRALNKLQSPAQARCKFVPSDALIQFLNQL